MNPLRKTRGIATALLAATLATTAFAQYTGPGSTQVARTVAEVLEDARDDRPAELSGHIIEQTGRERYRFKDSTGEITVEIDDEDFPAGQPIGADVLVYISGEIEARFMRDPRIDVERLRLTPPANASTNPPAPATPAAPPAPATPATP